jgi:uncharacterized protein with beta-barrel porin domain
VLVAPRDGGLYGAADFAFAESNEDSITALLGRTLADGGGNTFYNLGPVGGPAARGWMQVVGGFIDPSSAATHFRSSSGGLEGGADVALSDTARLGGAFGYEAGSLSDSDGGSDNQSLYRFSLYATQTLGTVGLSAAISYAHESDKDARASGLGAAVSSHGTDAVNGAVQIAAPFNGGGFSVNPAAGLIVSYVSTGAFAETDAINPGFAVSGTGASWTGVSPFAQVGISREFTTGQGLKITPDALIGYRYDAAASGGPVPTLIAADGTPFAAPRPGLNPNSALLGVSLTAHQGGWTAYLKYRASVASDWNDQSVDVGVRLAF